MKWGRQENLLPAPLFCLSVRTRGPDAHCALLYFGALLLLGYGPPGGGAACCRSLLHLLEGVLVGDACVADDIQPGASGDAAANDDVLLEANEFDGLAGYRPFGQAVDRVRERCRRS